MGLISWFQDCWVMMLRTKPQYLSVLGRKRSSVRSAPKLPQPEEQNCSTRLRYLVCVVVMCCSISYGVLLLFLQEDNALNASVMLIPLVIAALASISGGLCLSEYMSTQPQEVPSIYSCCYQNSSEVLAFFIGWTWILSQAATIAAICKISTTLLSNVVGSTFHRVLEQAFFSYADAGPAVAFATAFTLFVITGISETIVWYVVVIPLTFIMILSTFTLAHASRREKSFFYGGDWLEIESVSQVLTISSLCTLFFTGPQSLLRISQRQVRQQTAAALGPLNAISFVLVLSLIFVAHESGKILELKIASNSLISVTIATIFLICLCFLGIDSFYPLHFVTEDMATDGLLFRPFSRKCNPFCLPVASAYIQVLSLIGVSLLSALLPLKLLLCLAIAFPLFVNFMVPFLVLLQRYQDNTAWQYEPMFHTTAKNVRGLSRKKSEESQYTNGMGFDHTESIDMTTTCIQEESTEEEDSSDTDIDSVVQQYRDQTKIANMSVLDEYDPSEQQPEPTPSSSFRAKLCIGSHLLLAFLTSLALNFADLDSRFILLPMALVCSLFSIAMQGLLLCLPQNRRAYSLCCPKTQMPWIPGMASLINTCLFVHCLMSIWEVYLGWFLLGLLIYFSYGIRSSTAANSFHNLRPAHINLCPLPSYGNKCVPQIVPSQRKKPKSKHLRNGKKQSLGT